MSTKKKTQQLIVLFLKQIKWKLLLSLNSFEGDEISADTDNTDNAWVPTPHLDFAMNFTISLKMKVVFRNQ